MPQLLRWRYYSKFGYDMLRRAGSHFVFVQSNATDYTLKIDYKLLTKY